MWSSAVWMSWMMVRFVTERTEAISTLENWNLSCRHQTTICRGLVLSDARSQWYFFLTHRRRRILITSGEGFNTPIVLMFDVLSMSTKVHEKKGEKGKGEKMFCKIMKVKMPQMHYILVRGKNWFKYFSLDFFYFSR